MGLPQPFTEVRFTSRIDLFREEGWAGVFVSSVLGFLVVVLTGALPLTP